MENKVKKVFFLIVLLLIVPGFAFGADTDLGWVPPTENVDGSPLTDLAGYNVYIGSATGSYSIVEPITDPAATSATVTFSADWLVPGDNGIYVVMTALDATGNESVYSNEVMKTVSVVDDVAPNPPSAVVTITISIGVDCPEGYSCGVQ